MKKGFQEKAFELFLSQFWNLKLVPIDSALNSASVNLIQLFQNCTRSAKKAAKLENPVKSFLKYPL